MTNYQQEFLKALGNASKNNDSLVWRMQEGFKNKILDYTVSDEDFVQLGRIDSAMIALEDTGDLGSVISSMQFLNDFDKQSLLIGLTVEEGMLREAYTNSSNVALVINSFQDIFFGMSDSIRMLKFVRQMQKAYELDGREFKALEFFRQMNRIKNEFNSLKRFNVVMNQWTEQLEWAIEARNLTNTSNVRISDIKMLAGQVALSAAYSKEYLWGKHDQIAHVLKWKEEFFEQKLKNMVSVIDAPKYCYDFAKVDKHGNTILFKIGNKELLNNELKNTIEEVIDDNVNVIKLKGDVLCKAFLLNEGKIDVRRLTTKKGSFTIIRCDSVEEAIEVSNSEIFSDRAEIFNLTKDNMYSLYEYMIHEDNQNRIIDHKGNYYFKHRFEKKKDIINTKILSSSEVEPIRQNENAFFELLKEHVIASEKDFVRVRARNLYNSFRETLKYIGVRTPSQAMQSFMPLEVAIFVGSGSNLVYIPAAMTWFQGADYDIDKSFMMQLQLSGDIVDSGSNLSRRYAFSNLAKLPTPNNDITFTSSEKIYNVGEAIVYGGNVVVDAKAETKFFLGNTHVKLSDIQHTDKPKYFDTLKTVLNIANVHEAQKVGTNIIFINDLPSPTNDEIDKITHRFVRDLNSHNRTKLFNYWSRVMKNKVMYNAYDLLLNPVNLILESMPIAFGEIKDFADASTSGKRETKITGFNFMDKFIICEQAQLGKKEIGIVATGIKSYLVQTNVGNIKMVEMIDALKSARNDRDRSQALNIIARMMFERDVDSFSIGNDTSKSDYWGELSQGLSHKMGDRTVCLLANIDLQPLKELVDGTTDGILWGIDPLSIHKNLTKFIVKNDVGNIGLNIEALYKELTLGNANEDVLMALSALLSAATDNMKELILSKIRASESTMGLFCTMLMQGYSLTQILNVFASDAFGLIDKFSKTNIFNGANTHGGDVKTIIRFLLGETSLLGNRDWAFMSFLQNEDFLKEMKVNDNTSLYDFVKDILTNLKEGTGKKGELYAALRQILLFNKDNALVMLKWLNNKVSTIQRQYDRRNENEEVEDIDVDDDMIAENAWEGDEEFVDPDEYDYDESSTKTRAVVTSFNLKDFKLFRQFLEDCEYRNEFSESIKERTRELRLLIDQVIPAAEENKWSGKILKINQGLPKTPEELMKFITSLNSYVNRTLKKAGINMESFDLMTFLDDPVKQKMFIEVFDEIKYQQNILRTVMDSPNFRSMFKVLKDSYEYQQYAYVTRKVQSILEDYANNYLPTHDFGQTAITEEEYRAAQRVVQESIEANWIARLKRTFLVNPGDFVYTRTTGGKVGSRSISSQTPIGLSNADEFATFKYIMDNRVFPFLAERMIEMPTFATNEFLANLKPYSQRENRRLKATDFYKMDLNMVNIDKSIMLRDQYEKILKDFDLIKDLKLDMILVDANEDWAIGDWTIGELIYIYDIIQNKGKVGKNSFAKLFENSQNNPLYLDRINFLNALDDQEESISNIQIRDLLFNVAWYADIVSKVNGVVGVGESPQLSVEWNSNNSKIAKVTVGNVEINIAELPSDYTFFSLPFSTQVSDIQFITSKDSKTSRHSLSDPVVLNALYHALDLKLSGDHRFIKITSTEEIERSPEMFASQDRLDDYKVLPAFYDNDTLYLNRTNMTTKEPLYALAEVLSWVMSKADPENWNRFLTEQMPTWSKYQKHADALRTEDPLSRKHMIFGRFVQEYIQDTLRNVPEFNALKSTTETQIQRRMEEVINSIFETKKEGFNYFEYNLEDFVGLIGLMSRQKEKYAGIKLSAQMEAKLNLVKRQLISEGKLEIIGEC